MLKNLPFERKKKADPFFYLSIIICFSRANRSILLSQHNVYTLQRRRNVMATFSDFFFFFFFFALLLLDLIYCTIYMVYFTFLSC